LTRQGLCRSAQIWMKKNVSCGRAPDAIGIDA
jgi:hypothetical protein